MSNDDVMAPSAWDPDPPLPTREPRRLPMTRADCKLGPRPCPYVSCRHHLFLDVNDETGALTLRMPRKRTISPRKLSAWEPDDADVDDLLAVRDTCSLDVADREPQTLEQVGELTGLTRERVRQIEVRLFAKLREHPMLRELMGRAPSDD